MPLKRVRSLVPASVMLVLLGLLGSALDAAGDPQGTSSPSPALALAADTVAGTVAPSAGSVEDDLGPTTAFPWNPERPVPAAKPWEQIIRLPGRVVSLPFSAFGYATRRSMILVEEAGLISKAIYYLGVLPRLGLVLAPASLGDRTGFGLKARVALPTASQLFSAEADVSTRNYSSTRIAAGYGPARLEYGYDWRPREQFFGIGPIGGEDEAPSYAAQSQHVRLTVARILGKDRRWRSHFGTWVGPREIVTRTGREAPSFDQVFPGLAGFLDRRVEHLVYGARVALDGRRGVPHWSRGARVEIEAERFDKPVEALALRTSQAAFQFTRLEYRVEAGVSFYRDPRTIRLALRAVDQQPGTSGALLLPDLAFLGGKEGLYGFEPGRFHDTDLVLGKLSYIFPLAIRLELDVHAEAGAVYGDLWRDGRLSSLEYSYGVALRPRLDTAVLGAVGVDWSRETLRVRYSIGGVE